MSTNPTSPHLAPTSPNPPGATSESDLAHRPPPYGGEVAEKPNGDHHTNTHNHTPRGEVRGEVEPRSCTQCGCTDNNACIDNLGDTCWWAAPTLCSSCR